MTKKTHPADMALIAKIAEAAYFTIHLRTSPHDTIKKEAKTLLEAIAIRDELGTTPSGKRAMIYAVGADKLTAHVSSAAIAQARENGGKVEIATAGRAGAKEAKKSRKAVEGGKKAKRATAPRVPTSGRPMGRRAEIADNAAKGILPPVPDFSAETHRRFRGKLAEIVRLAEGGDVAALKAFPINPYSSSPKAMARYRDLAVQAIEARAG